MKKGKVIVLVAPSGSGKTTLARRLFKDFDELKFSVSATTRPPRHYEKDKKHYYFLSEADFNQKVADGEFLEWEEFYGGKKYGTLRSEVDKKLKSGYFVLLDIEVKGAVNIKQIYGDECLSLFIQPPSIEVLKQRLIDRGTEDDETLALRLQRAKKELTYADQFDQIIINDDLDAAYAKVKEAVIQFMNPN
jgi:guanylate kinase